MSSYWVFWFDFVTVWVWIAVQSFRHTNCLHNPCYFLQLIPCQKARKISGWVSLSRVRVQEAKSWWVWERAPSRCQLRGTLLDAGYGAPICVPVTGCPPRCWLWGALLGAGYGIPFLVLVTGHSPGCYLPGCRLRGALLGARYEVPPRCRLGGALLGAGYGLSAVDKTQNPCLGLPLKTSQTLTFPVRAARLSWSSNSYVFKTSRAKELNKHVLNIPETSCSSD